MYVLYFSSVKIKLTAVDLLCKRVYDLSMSVSLHSNLTK